MNISNGSTLYHYSKGTRIHTTIWIFSTNTTLCKIFFSSTPLGSLLAQLLSTAHEHKAFCKKTPYVTCNVPPNPYVVEWHHVTTIYAYVASRMVMVHSTTHYEYLGKPPALLIAPTRKIYSPNFYPHLMKPK